MSPRIIPLDPIPHDVLTRAEAAAGQPIRADAQVYRTLANHPDLFEAWLAWGAHVVRGTTLAPSIRELVILRVSLLCDGRYPLTQHVRIGRSAGLGHDALAQITNDPHSAGWDEATATTISAVDQLLTHHRLDDQRWTALVSQHGVAGVFDLVATVAFFRMACWMLNAGRTPFDEGQADVDLTLVGRFGEWGSTTDDTPRVTPLPLDAWPAPLLSETERWPRFEGRPDLRRAGVYSTLAHNPRLFSSIGPMMAHLLRDNALTDQQREIVIVRSCFRDRGAYPFRQHLRIAADLGVTPAILDQLVDIAPDIEDPTDAALVAMVDELHLTNHVSATTWHTVRSHLDTKATMDVIATAGFYGLISLVLTAAQTPLEPGAAALPDLPDSADQETSP